MYYEWDEQKCRENLAKHGIDFAEVEVAFQWLTAVIEPSPRYGEMRWRAIGHIGARLHTVIYAMRDDNIRIISLKRASAGDVRIYGQSRGLDTSAL